MLNFIINLAISIYLTSTIFMLICWANAVITTFRENGKIFMIPFGRFLYIHFCPIVHTIQCFRIMKRTAELIEQTEKRRM